MIIFFDFLRLFLKNRPLYFSNKFYCFCGSIAYQLIKCRNLKLKSKIWNESWCGNPGNDMMSSGQDPTRKKTNLLIWCVFLSYLKVILCSYTQLVLIAPGLETCILVIHSVLTAPGLESYVLMDCQSLMSVP